MSDALEAPDQSYVVIVAALIRGLLQIASGCGFTWALAVTGDHVTMAATAAVMAGTLVWSTWQKIAAKRRANFAAQQSAVKSAVATAEAGEPTVLPVKTNMPA